MKGKVVRAFANPIHTKRTQVGLGHTLPEVFLRLVQEGSVNPHTNLLVSGSMGIYWCIRHFLRETQWNSKFMSI